MTSRAFSPSRLVAILTKELIQMRRDRLTFGMMVGVPLIQLLLFGFAINTDPKALPAALLSVTEGPYSRAVITALENTGYYRFDEMPKSEEEANRLIAKGAILFLVTIPGDFEARVKRGDHPMLLIEADATDPAAATNAIGTLGEIAATALDRELGRMTDVKRQSGSDLQIVVHRRYNPEGISQYNIVPGLLGVILQMTMVMMTAMALTREIERGTMENLLAMPATPFEIMLGKIIPFIGIGAVQVAVVLSVSRLLFDIPFLGSLALLLAAILVYITALVLLGLYVFDACPLADAGDAAHLLFLPAIDPPVGIHVPVPRHAGLGADGGRVPSAHPFPPHHQGHHAERRHPARHWPRAHDPRNVRGRFRAAGAPEVPPHPRLSGVQAYRTRSQAMRKATITPRMPNITT
jgi:ABC-2 type transport system permease protein